MRQGLFRLWVVASCVWFLGFATPGVFAYIEDRQQAERMCDLTLGEPWCVTKPLRRNDAYAKVAVEEIAPIWPLPRSFHILMALGGPLAGLALLRSGFWIADGFKRPPTESD